MPTIVIILSLTITQGTGYTTRCLLYQVLFLLHTENLYEEPVEAMKRDTIYMNLEEAKTEYMNTNRPT